MVGGPCPPDHTACLANCLPGCGDGVEPCAGGDAIPIGGMPGGFRRRDLRSDPRISLATFPAGADIMVAARPGTDAEAVAAHLSGRKQPPITIRPGLPCVPS